MRKLPSPWSIVFTDSACYHPTWIGLVLFFLPLMVKITGTVPGSRGRPDQPVDPEFANLALACGGTTLVLLWSIVALRVSRIRSLFDSGEEIEATVEKVTRSRGGSTLKLQYERAGTTYRVRSSFLRSSRFPTFTAGDRVSLLVDRMNPKRVAPTALYTDNTDTAPSPNDGHCAAAQPSVAVPWPRRLGLRLSSGASRSARRGDDR